MSKKTDQKENKLTLNKILIIVVIFLVLTNILTLALQSNAKEEAINTFKNPYPYLDISRNFIEQTDFIVNFQPLTEELNKLLEEYKEDNVAFYFEYLNSGANIVHNPDARYYPASLIKMPVAIAAIKKVESGEWDWDDKLIISSEDVDTGFGVVGEMPIGTPIKIRDLARELLTKSDNTAYNMFVRNMGVGPVNDFLIDTGLNDFFDKNLSITAKEYTRLIRSLYTASYLRRPFAEEILKLLNESERNYLGQAIPTNINFAHKFGENVEERIFADSGIVYIPNRPYVLTVLYKSPEGESKEDVDNFFKKISKSIYDYVNNYNNVE